MPPARVPSPHPLRLASNARKRSLRQRRQHPLGLQARADDHDGARFLHGQQVGGDRAGCARAHGGDQPRFENGLVRAVAAIDQQDDAAQIGQAARHIAAGFGVHLDRVALAVRQDAGKNDRGRFLAVFRDGALRPDLDFTIRAQAIGVAQGLDQFGPPPQAHHRVARERQGLRGVVRHGGASIVGRTE